MTSTVLDSALYRDMFGTAAMRGIFSDEGMLRRCLVVEAALARAESRVGVIPPESGAAISQAADRLVLDMDRLRRETETVGFPIVALVHQLAEAAGEAGRHVHWGATTQDIMDSAVVLQIRDALAIIEADLAELGTILADLARRHRDTPMPGRTHLQHALPITFGYKVAVWLSMIDRHAGRLKSLRPRVLVGQFGGAVGTLASLGGDGLAVRAALMQELGLDEPTVTWHVARDLFAETVQFLGLVTASLGKIALDVSLMASTEIAEAAEPFVKGRGSSSTMPQKRNPISSEIILGAARITRQHSALILDAMVQDFERATGPWHAEWIALPESFLYTGGALAQARFMLGGLIVDADRMRRNLDLTSGLIVAEAVMMRLAVHFGRQQAHDLVYDACRNAAESGQSLFDILAANPMIADPLGGREALRAIVDPAGYLGSAPLMVDRAVQR